MKKSLVITLFLVLSSFFFISIKEVKADDPFIVDLSTDVLNSIDSEFFTVRDSVIEYANSNSLNYLLFRINDKYLIYFSKKDSFTSTGRSWLENKSESFSYASCSSENLELQFGTRDNYNITYSTSNLKYLLDSTMSVYYSPYEVQINYNGKSYLVNSTTKFKTIYDLYLESGGEVPDPHKSEKQIIANFYTICIDKLGYLGEQIVSNYVYLSMIVVLILVFIIELIRRWLM